MADYDGVFYRCSARGALSTARFLVPWVGGWVRPRSIADFGCGPGVWLGVWREWGVADLVGVDRRAVDLDGGQWTSLPFVEMDLCQPVRLGRTFDLAQCLEVGEHLPATAALTLVETLTAHAPVVLFSSALPGQGGFQHVNERPPDYWRELFARRKFGVADCVRPRLIAEPQVRLCSRYNTFLYVHESRWDRLPDVVRDARVREGVSIRDLSPGWLRLGRAVIRLFPVRVVSLVDRGLRRVRHPGRRPSATIPAGSSRAISPGGVGCEPSPAPGVVGITGGSPARASR